MPSIAATTGLPIASICACTSRAIGGSAPAPEAISLMSAPAEKMPPAPVSTRARTAVASASARRRPSSEPGAHREAQRIHRRVGDGEHRHPLCDAIVHGRHGCSRWTLLTAAWTQCGHCTGLRRARAQRAERLHCRCHGRRRCRGHRRRGRRTCGGARARAAAARDTLILEAAERFGTGHQRAQQRGDPRRHLLSAGLAQGAPVRRRARAAVRVQPQARRRPSALRQADRGHRDGAAARTGGARGERARANGVELAALEAAEARRLEPELACEAALHSPLTGIIDSQGLDARPAGEAEAHGATLAHPQRR